VDERSFFCTVVVVRKGERLECLFRFFHASRDVCRSRLARDVDAERKEGKDRKGCDDKKIEIMWVVAAESTK
jgi:hypothetical protein